MVLNMLSKLILDVGDRINFDKEDYYVIEFGITTTILKKWDGKEIYGKITHNVCISFIAPNIILATKFINNIRRSGNQMEQIFVQIESSTPQSKVNLLKSHLVTFLNENYRDYIPVIDIYLQSLTNRSSIEMSMLLDYKGIININQTKLIGNWEDGIRFLERRSRFMIAMKEGMNKIGIQVPRKHQINTGLII